MNQKILFISIILLFVIISCGKYQDNLLIKDEKFQVKKICDARGVMIFSWKHNKLYWRDKNSVHWEYEEDGTTSFFCHGMIHVWEGKAKYGFYTFISTKDDPLQFIVDKNIGYYYIGGRGKVITPEGKVINLRIAK